MATIEGEAMKTATPQNPLQALLAQCELQAARDLVNRWDSRDGEDLAAKDGAENGDCPPAMPMWSTVWDSGNGPNLAELLRPMGPPRFEDVPEPDQTKLARPNLGSGPIGHNRAHSDALQKWAAEYGLADEARQAIAELDEFADGETVDGMYDPIADEIEERWLESGDDNAELHRSGWQYLGDTGILARDFEGALHVGVNGAGYDFYDAHWLPLYRALELDWHVQAYRQERADTAAVAVLAAWKRELRPDEALGAALRQSIEFLDRTRAALANFGPLAAWETEP